jgi:hypothetical protein
MADLRIWQRAASIAAKTPPERNRVVDFLRALSILAVVVGHWLVAAPFVEDGAVVGGHLLGIAPWTQWLTWLFQVMPLFFLVGGFSNGVSWAAAQRNGGGSWTEWFASRVRRLIAPVLPLFLVWTLFALFGTALGVERGIVRMAAQLALVPVWFLAVYLIVTALTPVTHAAWTKAGWLSVVALIAGAVAVDFASLRIGVPYINFANFLFVWLTIHQLGYAWAAGHFSDRGRALALGLGGLVALSALINLGPYPVAMIGVPGTNLSNSMPPTLALLALGAMQAGLALALEPNLRRMLASARAWTWVVLVNAMIMTIYLWHLTAFVAVIALAWLFDGIGLHSMPASADWWLTRPVWFALYILVTLPLVMLFVRFESPGREPIDPRRIPHWRLIAGLLMICVGLAMTAAISIASPQGVTGVRLWVVALPFIGAALIRFGPVYSLTQRG